MAHQYPCHCAALPAPADFEGMLLTEFDTEYKEYLRRWAAGDTGFAFPGERGA